MTSKVDYIAVGSAEGVVTARVPADPNSEIMISRLNSLFNGFAIIDLSNAFAIEHYIKCSPSEFDPKITPVVLRGSLDAAA